MSSNAGPATCRWCRRSEPNRWLLENNHAPVSWNARATRTCTAMHLTRNHVIYDLDHDDAERLTRSVARAREVWPTNQQDWLDQLLSAPPLPGMVRA